MHDGICDTNNRIKHKLDLCSVIAPPKKLLQTSIYVTVSMDLIVDLPMEKSTGDVSMLVVVNIWVRLQSYIRWHWNSWIMIWSDIAETNHILLLCHVQRWQQDSCIKCVVETMCIVLQCLLLRYSVRGLQVHPVNGEPAQLITDRESRFVTPDSQRKKEWKNSQIHRDNPLWGRCGGLGLNVKQRLTTAYSYHPQSDGEIEKMNRIQILRSPSTVMRIHRDMHHHIGNYLPGANVGCWGQPNRYRIALLIIGCLTIGFHL